MNYIKKVWAGNSDAGYFQAANLLAIFSMVSFILIRLPEYVSRELYAKAAVLLVACLGAVAVMIVLMVSVKKITTLAFWIPLVIFISYTAGTLYLRGAFYYFLVYLVICGIGASYYDYKKMFRFMLLSNGVILVLIFLRMPLLGEDTAFNDSLVTWIITVYISIFLLMLSRFSTDKSSRSARALDSFSTMMAATPNLVALVNEMNRVTYISRPLALWAHIEDYEMVIDRPLIDLFHEMDMKIMISEVLLTKGAYEGTKELNRDGKMFYFKIIANDLRGSTRGKFIDISDITPIMEARLEAERAANAKSNFLANTSHEIRTPMNAILGMAELLLRKDIAPDVYEDALSIKQAGSNLLAIINDILDFSKIESGKLEIVPAEYLFASLINDVISIIRMRIAEKPILFIVDSDPKLPGKLKGDEVRIRQILLNLLSNAVKYTRSGHITFTITGKAGDGQILLTITVADTGIGIKEENMTSLFGEFVQFDSHKNRGVEGTGLGLAISRNLCRLMGGDITVESRYGEGSVFTATLPQQVEDEAPLASVDAPETKPVLLYEGKEPYALSLIRSLENLAVPVRALHEPEDLYRELERSQNAGQPYSFVFASADVTEKILVLLKTLKLRTNGRQPVPVALSDVVEISSFQNVAIISMPAYVLSLANVLNGKQTVSFQEKPSAAFIAPDAKILIVDDSITNLTVARGLLAIYRMDIHVCTGGMEAVNLVKKNSYDMVFMDHMMPEMDGLEATDAIRALEGDYFKNIPIVALTANAVSGMKEMFLERGFNDYLPKPIEIAKLNELIRKWIPKDKQQKASGETTARPSESTIKIPGIDAARGIAMTGGTEEGYRKVLTSFCKDALIRLSTLKDPPDEQALSLFTTNVHALKSAAVTIGAVDLSSEAAELEALSLAIAKDIGKSGDMDRITEKLPGFCVFLKDTVEHIRGALAEKIQGVSSGGLQDAGVYNLFLELKAAAGAKDMEAIDRVTGELTEKNLDKEARETLDAVSDLLLVAKFKQAVTVIDTLCSPNHGRA
jgi:signal transduction histidine kinase/CheY-like chemotaxis protein/HPt (histidine-containing phosphotransfer) domain-containing protein